MTTNDLDKTYNNYLYINKNKKQNEIDILIIKITLYIVKKNYFLFNSNNLREDCIQNIIVNLIKYYKNNNLDFKDNNFTNILIRQAENELILFFKNNKKYIKDNISLEELKIYELQYNIYYKDENLYYTDDYLLQNYYKKELLNKIMNMLNEREKLIIKLRFGFFEKCYTQREVSILLNTSQHYISMIEKRTLKKLKRNIL